MKRGPRRGNSNIILGSQEAGSSERLKVFIFDADSSML